jgi:hypothetical protein
MHEYTVLSPGEEYQDIVRGISERERQDKGFAAVEKLVDLAFDDLGVGVTFKPESARVDFAGAYVDAFTEEVEMRRARAREIFNNRPA